MGKTVIKCGRAKLIANIVKQNSIQKRFERLS